MRGRSLYPVVAVLLALLYALLAAAPAEALITEDPSELLLWRSDGLGGDVYRVSWSPDGSKLAAGGDFERVYVFSAGGKLLWRSEDLDGRVWSVSWSPDGSKLAAGGYFNRVYVFYGGFLVLRVSSVTGAAVTVSGPGGTLTLSLDENEERTIYLDPGTYTVSYTLPEPEGFIGDPGVLQGSLQITVNNPLETLKLGYESVLGSIVVEVLPPARADVVVSWDGGLREFRSVGWSLRLWASPGSYTVTLSPLPVLGFEVFEPVSRTVSVEPGSTVTLEFSLLDFPLDERVEASLMVAAVSAAVSLSSWFYWFRLRGRLVVEGVEGELVRGLGGYLRVRVSNPGRLRWRGQLVLTVNGVEVYRGEVELGGGESREVAVRVDWDPRLEHALGGERR